MREILITQNSLPAAYHMALYYLQHVGEETDCADWDCKQKEVSMTFHVTEPLAEPMISKLFIGGAEDLEQYRQEMLYGILDFEVAKGNWDYTYHQRMEHQIPFIIAELRRNPSSRRAVIDVRDNSKDMYSGDPACLQHIQYFIRNGRLDCMVLFRSNDACKATFMNAFALIMLQAMIAHELDIPVGEYTHTANSFHCYEKDYKLLESYANRISNSSLTDITYRYVGEWDEMMREAEPYIRMKVQKLKEKK